MPCSESQNQLNVLCSVGLLLASLCSAISGWESAEKGGGGLGGPARLWLCLEEEGGGLGGPARLWLRLEEEGGI